MSFNRWNVDWRGFRASTVMEEPHHSDSYRVVLIVTTRSGDDDSY